MDYLDLKKERQYHILLMLGYLLVAVAITIAAMILLYQAHGFGVNKNGVVVQNGLVFFSSKPNPATIYANGKPQPNSTNTRLSLAAGVYNVKISRNGYWDWQRKISVQGDDVQHFDYPFLIPKQLDTTNIRSFAGMPGLFTNSPDHRWLVIQPTSLLTSLQVYDLKNPNKDPLPLDIPIDILTKGTTEKWQIVDWADDNKHLLVEHDYDDKTEFILLDRTAAGQSVNLNKTLSVNPTKLEFKNRKYDQYYAYEAASQTLRSMRLQGSADEPIFQRVIAYKSYGTDTLLYVTDSGAPPGKVLVKLASGTKTYNIRQFTAGSNYVVDLTKYSGTMYVVAGSTVDNKVYIYQDPAGQLDSGQVKVPGPQQVMHVTGVNYVSFSSSAQFVMAENGNHFGVYDLENKLGYNYTTAEPLDAPQLHASWMDGNRMIYVTAGQPLIFDYDHLNKHLVGKSVADYKPAFDPDFKNLYLLSPAENGQFNLAETFLLTKTDR